MATLRDILSDIELRVTAGRPTDEERYNWAQAAFILNVTTAKLLRDRALEQIQLSNDRYHYESDPILWKTYTLTVQTDSQGIKYVELPYPPVSMPINFGIKDVFTIDPRYGAPNKLSRGTYSSADTGRNRDFAQPQYVYSGTRLELYNAGLISTVNIVAVNSGQDMDASLDSEYPLPEDLIGQAVMEVTQILLGQQQLPDDVYNDGKDESVKSV